MAIFSPFLILRFTFFKAWVPSGYVKVKFETIKNGKVKVTYISKEIEEVLEPTYGILIYQEQVNKIAQVMGGFSPEEADLFRRAISKKDIQKLDSNKEAFLLRLKHGKGFG